MKARTLLSFIAAGLALVPGAFAQPTNTPGSALPPGSSLEAGQRVYASTVQRATAPTATATARVSLAFPQAAQFQLRSVQLQSTPPDRCRPTTISFKRSRAACRELDAGLQLPSETQRRDAVQYVKRLTAITDASGKRVNKFERRK
jgi:hypothetical protein